MQLKVQRRSLLMLHLMEKVKSIRSEFTSWIFQSLLSKNAIRHETCARYSPHQNGTAESNWRTEMARCMLIESKLPKYLWTYAVQTAAMICNRCYNRQEKARCRLWWRVFVGHHRNCPAHPVFCPDTGTVLKNRLVKFITKSATECHAQTDESESEKRVETQRPKPDIDRNSPTGNKSRDMWHKYQC